MNVVGRTIVNTVTQLNIEYSIIEERFKVLSSPEEADHEFLKEHLRAIGEDEVILASLPLLIPFFRTLKTHLLVSVRQKKWNLQP